jgi:hypothetical protein
VAPLLNEDNTTCNTPQVLLIRVADPDPDPGGQKRPTKVEKKFKSSCFEELKASSVT